MGVFSGIVKRWLGENEGVTAIEFSLLATPFVFIAIGIIELSMMFVANSLLLGAVDDAARAIRTGQVQQASGETSLQAFQNALCQTSGILLDCSQMQYQVQTIDDFSDADMSKPQVDKNGNLIAEPFDPGSSGSVVLIRVVYLYPLMTPMIGQFFSDYPGNKKMLMATVVIENEPYSDSSGG